MSVSKCTSFVEDRSALYRWEYLSISFATERRNMLLQANSSRVWCRLKFQSEAVFHSFSPLFNYSRCFGLIPFSISKHFLRQAQRVHVRFVDLVWPCITIAILLNFAFTNMLKPNNSQVDLKNTHILVLGDRALLGFGLVMAAFSIVLDMINRNRILWTIQRFESFDKEVSNHEKLTSTSNIHSNFYTLGLQYFRCITMAFRSTIIVSADDWFCGWCLFQLYF